MFLEVEKLVVLKSSVYGIKKYDNNNKITIIVYTFDHEPISLTYESVSERDHDYRILVNQLKESAR